MNLHDQFRLFGKRSDSLEKKVDRLGVSVVELLDLLKELDYQFNDKIGDLIDVLHRLPWGKMIYVPNPDTYPDDECEPVDIDTFIELLPDYYEDFAVDLVKIFKLMPF